MLSAWTKMVSAFPCFVFSWRREKLSPIQRTNKETTLPSLLRNKKGNAHPLVVLTHTVVEWIVPQWLCGNWTEMWKHMRFFPICVSWSLKNGMWWLQLNHLMRWFGLGWLVPQHVIGFWFDAEERSGKWQERVDGFFGWETARNLARQKVAELAWWMITCFFAQKALYRRRNGL